jgi:hypothetical protein
MSRNVTLARTASLLVRSGTLQAIKRSRVTVPDGTDRYDLNNTQEVQAVRLWQQRAHSCAGHVERRNPARLSGDRG